MKTVKGQRRPVPADGGRCPHCGFVNDRPHASLCLRCNGELPGSMGCKGCGACRAGG